MKYIYKKVFIFILLIFYISCDFLIDNSLLDETEITGDLHLKINKPDLFRTVTPNLDINSYMISFEGEEEMEPINSTSNDIVIELPVGLWIIIVSGLDINETTIASVSTDPIYIYEGSILEEEVIISPLLEGIGFIDIIISWPTSVGIDSYEIQLNNIIIDENKIEITYDNGYYYLRYRDNVEYGSHKFTLYLSKNDSVVKMILEMIQVYGNLKTSSLLTYTEDDF